MSPAVLTYFLQSQMSIPVNLRPPPYKSACRTPLLVCWIHLSRSLQSADYAGTQCSSIANNVVSPRRCPNDIKIYTKIQLVFLSFVLQDKNYESKGTPAYSSNPSAKLRFYVHKKKKTELMAPAKDNNKTDKHTPASTASPRLSTNYPNHPLTRLFLLCYAPGTRRRSIHGYPLYHSTSEPPS